jgi:autotransporter-associated beta strand protein
LSNLTFQGTASASGLNIKAGSLTVNTAATLGALEGAVGTTLNMGGPWSTNIASGSKTFAGVLGGAGAFTKAGAGSLVLTGNNTYTGATTIDAGTLVLQNDAPTMTTSGYSGTGALTIQPNGTSFTSAFSTSAWKISNTLTGLTLGKVGNTADVTLMLKDASNNPVTFMAPVNMYGGNLYVESPYAWNTSATSTLRASSNISSMPTLTSQVPMQA